MCSSVTCMSNNDNDFKMKIFRLRLLRKSYNTFYFWNINLTGVLTQSRPLGQLALPSAHSSTSTHCSRRRSSPEPLHPELPSYPAGQGPHMNPPSSFKQETTSSQGRMRSHSSMSTQAYPEKNKRSSLRGFKGFCEIGGPILYTKHKS